MNLHDVYLCLWKGTVIFRRRKVVPLLQSGIIPTNEFVRCLFVFVERNSDLSQTKGRPAFVKRDHPDQNLNSHENAQKGSKEENENYS